MADRVTDEHLVCLNNVIFPIEGFVRESLISRFPAKLITGDYDFANEQIISNWIVNDQRGGMLVEEMDEAVHQDRYWWSTCDTRFRNELTLPPLATTVTIPSGVTEPTLANMNFEATGTWSQGVRHQGQVHGGSYSFLITANVTGTQSASNWTNDWQSVEFTFLCYVWSDTASNARIQIYDGVGTTQSSDHSGGSGWELLTVTRTLDGSATALTIGLDCDGVGNTYYDDAALTAL